MDRSTDISSRRVVVSAAKTTLLDLISLDELQQLQDTLAQMHNVASIITTPGGRLITTPSNEIPVCRLIRSSSKGLIHCMDASRSTFPKAAEDRDQACRMCERMGILRVAVPVVANDIHLANWWVSQYCGSPPSPSQLIEISEISGVSADRLSGAYPHLYKGDQENFHRIIEWLKTLSDQITKWVYEKHVLSRNLSRLNHVESELNDRRVQMEQEIEHRTAELIRANNRLQLEVFERDQSERRLGLALESANEGLWDYTPMTGHVYYSPRWFTMLGYQAGDFPETLETWCTLTHPEELPLLEGALQKIAAGQSEVFNIETRMLSRSGKWYWLQVRGRAVEFDKDGKGTRIVGSLIDISKYKQVEVALQKANNELHRLAALDDLTQIANRRRFDDRLAQEWSRGRREKNSLAIIICDIDYFKDYNDTYGHLKGDETLHAVAQAISAALKRPTDLVARFGGEEFAMILPNTNINGARRVALEVKDAVAAMGIEHKTSKVYHHITLSYGVAAIVPRSELPARALVEKADQALYRAKSKGRNQIDSTTPS